MSADVTPLRRSAPSESPVDTARRLEAEAKDIAATAARTLLTDLVLVSGRCGDISTLVSLPPGVRDVLRRLGETIEGEVEKTRAVMARLP